MNFDLGPQETALRDGIRELCAKRFPIERVREMTSVDKELWRELWEAGVFTLRVPQEAGGVGLGMTESVIVFQELGRALVPGPLVATLLAAARVAPGTVVALLDPPVVEHLESADRLLRPDGGLSGPVDGTPLDALDPLTPVHRVDGEPFAAYPAEGVALTAALLAGIAGRTTELAVEYAKDREQFGKPIGSFQAVKHMCADMLVRAEVARAAVDAAGVLLDSDDESGVAAAKLLAGDAAVDNAKACIQVHGGMGFTWEADPHLYLKRAAVLAASFGSSDDHAEAIASRL